MLSWLIALWLSLAPYAAHAQQLIQIPVCSGALPSSVNPSAPTITVNASGQVCTAGTTSITLASPLSVTIAGSPQTVVFAASPIGITIAGSPQQIVGTVTTSGSPQNITFSSSPVGVTIVGSPIQITGNLTSNPVSPQTVVVSAGNITATGSPATIVFPASPIGVTIVGSPLQVTGNFTSNPTSPQSVLVLAGNITTTGSPSTVVLNSSPLSVTVVGSPMAIDAADGAIGTLGSQADSVLTNQNFSASVIAALKGIFANVLTPISVTPKTSPQGVAIAGSPQQVVGTITTSGSPATVVLASSPIGVTVAGSPIQVVGTVTMSGSPATVILAASPISVTEATSPNTVVVSQQNPSLPSAAQIIAWTMTQQSNITNAAIQLVPSGARQLGKIVCDGQSASWGFLQIFDAATSGAVTVGTTVPKEYLPLAPSSLNGFVNPPPGDGFANGIVVAATTTVPTGSNAIGTRVNCSASYN